jgi:F-type H+-transporting ATPase subunit b
MLLASRLRRRFAPLVRRLAAPEAVAGLLLFSAGPLFAQEAGGGGSSVFSINPGLMIWTWVIFLLLLFVLRKWAWGPILGTLEAREQRIQQALEGAAREREEAGQLLEQQRQLLEGSRERAQQILADSRKAAERLRSELLDEARAQKDQIVARAKDEIERERDQALEVLRRETVDLSIAAAGRVLQKNLDAEENRRLVEEYLERLAVERGEGS